MSDPLLPNDQPAYVRSAKVRLSNGLYAFPHEAGVALVKIAPDATTEETLVVLTPEALAMLGSLANLNGYAEHRHAVNFHARRAQDAAFVQTAFPTAGTG